MTPASCFSCGFPPGLGNPPTSLFLPWFSTVTGLGSRLLEPFLFLLLLLCSLTCRVRLGEEIKLEIYCWMIREKILDHQEMTADWGTAISGIKHLKHHEKTGTCRPRTTSRIRNNRTEVWPKSLLLQGETFWPKCHADCSIYASSPPVLVDISAGPC